MTPKPPTWADFQALIEINKEVSGQNQKVSSQLQNITGELEKVKARLYNGLIDEILDDVREMHKAQAVLCKNHYDMIQNCKSDNERMRREVQTETAAIANSIRETTEIQHKEILSEARKTNTTIQFMWWALGGIAMSIILAYGKYLVLDRPAESKMKAQQQQIEQVLEQIKDRNLK